MLRVPPSSFQRADNAQPLDHPLDPLTSEEIIKVSSLLKAQTPQESLHFKRIELIEPPKKQLRAYLQAELRGEKPIPLPRRAHALYYHRETPNLFTADVDISNGEIESIKKVDSRFQAQADLEEVVTMREACLAHPLVKKELERIKLPEGSRIQCDTWPYGRDSGVEKRRLIQCYMYAADIGKQHGGSNAYDFPLDFSPVFDIQTKELVTIYYLPLDAGQEGKPQEGHIPHKPREYHQDLRDTPTRTDLKPLHVQQPQGASFTVEGHLVKWQKWRFRVGFNWREGLILHNVTYDGRELFHRLSLSEMFVPYGSPQAPYHRKSVFDVGDIGAGVAANDLRLGCDCLGLIKYFSFVISNSNGEPVKKPNAVCMHEQDNGIGWKHTDTKSGAGMVSITRARILVLQTIITVGNYDYIFAWHLDQAAGLHYQIQATGILSTAPIAPNTQVPWGTNVNQGVVAHYHQHIFCLRIDPSLDGPNNSFIEEDSVPLPLGPENPYGVGYTVKKTALTTSGTSEFAPNRVHKIVNPSIINPTSGRPIAYAIHSPVKQMLLAHPTSWHARRAKYARHPFWITQYRDGELYPAGDYTYQSLPPSPETGNEQDDNDLGAWASRSDSVENEDIVIWHSISLTHNPRTEDYPVMPCDTMTVSLKPSGFFEVNPALDVPQSTQEGNRSVEVEEGGVGGNVCAGGCGGGGGEKEREKPKL